MPTMSHCPKCGAEIQENTNFCANCGYSIETRPIARKGLVNHLKFSFKFIKTHPIIFIPEFLAGIVTYGMRELFGMAGKSLNIGDYILKQFGVNGTRITTISDVPDIPPIFWILPFIVILILLLISGVSGLFSFTTYHMAWNGYRNEKIDLRSSSRYTLSHVGKFFIASIIANLFALTIILLPAAMFMYGIMIVENTGIRNGLSGGFKLSLDKIGASAGLAVLYFIILAIIVRTVPYVGNFLVFIPVVIIEIASLDLYMNYKLENE